MKVRDRIDAVAARMRQVLRPPAADQLFDAGGLAGVGLISFGAWQIYDPAGAIVLGTFLLAAAWLNGRAKG